MSANGDELEEELSEELEAEEFESEDVEEGRLEEEKKEIREEFGEEFAAVGPEAVQFRETETEEGIRLEPFVPDTERQVIADFRAEQQAQREAKERQRRERQQPVEELPEVIDFAKIAPLTSQLNLQRDRPGGARVRNPRTGGLFRPRVAPRTLSEAERERTRDILTAAKRRGEIRIEGGQIEVTRDKDAESRDPQFAGEDLPNEQAVERAKQRGQLQREFAARFEGVEKTDVELETVDGQIQASLPEDIKRRVATRDIEQQLEEKFDQELTPGEDFTVKQTGEGDFKGELTDAFFESQGQRPPRAKEGEILAFETTVVDIHGDRVTLRGRTEEELEEVFATTDAELGARGGVRKEKALGQAKPIFESDVEGMEFGLDERIGVEPEPLLPRDRGSAEEARQEARKEVAEAAGEGFTAEDVEIKETDEGGEAATISAEAEKREATEDFEKQLEEEFDREFEPGADFTVERTEEGFERELASGVRETLVREQAEANLEKEFDRDLTPGEDFEVKQTDEGFEPKLTESFRETLVRERVAEQVAGQLRENIAQVGVFEEREGPIEAGDEIVVETGGDGEPQARLSADFARQISPVILSGAEETVAISDVFESFDRASVVTAKKRAKQQAEQALEEQFGTDFGRSDVTVRSDPETGRITTDLTESGTKKAQAKVDTALEGIGFEGVGTAQVQAPTAATGGEQDFQAAAGGKAIDVGSAKAIGEQTRAEIEADAKAQAVAEARASGAAAAASSIPNKIEREVQAETGAELERGEDFTVSREDSGTGPIKSRAEERSSVELTEAGREKLQAKQSEEFGDFPVVIGARTGGGAAPASRRPEAGEGQRLEAILRSAGEDVSGVIEDLTAKPGEAGENQVVLESATAQALRAAGREDLATTVRETQASFVQGAGEILNVPRTAVGIKEAGEFVGFGASETAAGRGEEFAEDATEAGVEAGEAFAARAAEQPVKTGAFLGGALAASSAVITGAARASKGAGRATAFAIQPGEELAGIGGFRATRALRSEKAAKRLFPNKEPLIFSEEGAIRAAKRVGGRVKGAGSRVRGVEVRRTTKDVLSGKPRTEIKRQESSFEGFENARLTETRPGVAARAQAAVSRVRSEFTGTDRAQLTLKSEGKVESEAETEADTDAELEEALQRMERADEARAKELRERLESRFEVQENPFRSRARSRQKEAQTRVTSEAESEGITDFDIETRLRRETALQSPTAPAQRRQSIATRSEVLAGGEGPLGKPTEPRSAVESAIQRQAAATEQQIAPRAGRDSETAVEPARQRQSVATRSEVLAGSEGVLEGRSELRAGVETNIKTDLRTRQRTDDRQRLDDLINADLRSQLDVRSRSRLDLQLEQATRGAAETETESRRDTRRESELEAESELESQLEVEAEGEKLESELELSPAGEGGEDFDKEFVAPVADPVQSFFKDDS